MRSTLLLQVVFCLVALTMLLKYVPRVREALRREAGRRAGAALLPIVNVVLALAILVAAALAVAVNAGWVDLISR